MGFPPKKDPKAAMAEEMSESESESESASSASASSSESSASEPPAPQKKGGAPNPLMQWAAAYKK